LEASVLKKKKGSYIAIVSWKSSTASHP